MNIIKLTTMMLLPVHGHIDSRPHVAFILVDDWGSADAAFREADLRPGAAPQLRTPTIDQLARQGVQLSQYYVQHICSPTRSALLSGRYQIHTGLQDGIIQAWARVCLPPKFGTLADAFTDLGYETHAVGKWHAGIYRDSCLPWNRGFDTYYGFLTGSEHHYTKIQRIARGDGSGNASHPAKLYPDLRTHEGPVKTECIASPLSSPPASCYSTHMFTQRATELIRAHNISDTTRPLFLYLALQDVHEPIEVPKAYEVPFAGSILDGTRRTYAGMVSAVDACVANVTTALRDHHEMWNNTILVLSNDNGGWVGYGGLNTPYRGHKTTLWEGGIRGLGIVIAPGRLHTSSMTSAAGSGLRFHGLFHVTDWLPTLVTAVGGSIHSLDERRFGGLDGVDQWNALIALSTSPTSMSGALRESQSFPRTEILHNIEGVGGTGIAVLRVGRYKLLHRMARDFDGWCDACNSTAGCWMPKGSGPGAEQDDKIVPHGGQLCCLAAPPWATNHSASCAPFAGTKPLPADLLYDVEADPSEQYDLAPSSPELLERMHTRLRVYNESAVPCCICTGSDRTDEMDRPPKDGFWFSFADQGPNPSKDCALQNEPVPLPARREQ